MPRDRHLSKLETGCEKTPMMNAGGTVGMMRISLGPDVGRYP
jgi:hypothetical protein